MSKGKKKGIRRRRKHKVSEGIHGATKHPLTEVQKVLLGKGLFQSRKPLVPEHHNKKEAK